MILLERTAQVWGITGLLGGGKSLTAVQFAVDAMSQGFFVCSNITIKIDVVAAHYGEFTRKLYKHISLDDPTFDPFKLPCGSPRGSGGKKRVLVILDECAEWVDQYSSAKDPRISRFWSWLRHTSKRSQDVFIVVQRREYLNKVVRILVSRWIWVNDLAVFKLPVLKCRFPFCGGLVMRNIYDIQDRRIGSVTFASKSYWGRFYDTSECLNSDGALYNFEYDVPERRPSGVLFLVLLLVLSQIVLYRALDRSSDVRSDPLFDEPASPYVSLSHPHSKSANWGSIAYPLFCRLGRCFLKSEISSCFHALASDLPMTVRQNLSQKNADINFVFPLACEADLPRNALGRCFLKSEISSCFHALASDLPLTVRDEQSLRREGSFFRPCFCLASLQSCIRGIKARFRASARGGARQRAPRLEARRRV